MHKYVYLHTFPQPCEAEVISIEIFLAKNAAAPAKGVGRKAPPWPLLSQKAVTALCDISEEQFGNHCHLLTVSFQGPDAICRGPFNG